MSEKNRQRAILLLQEIDIAPSGSKKYSEYVDWVAEVLDEKDSRIKKLEEALQPFCYVGETGFLTPQMFIDAQEALKEK